MKPFISAVIQFDVRLGDIDRNLGIVKRRVRTLAGRGVRLVVLPEMLSTGFANERLVEMADTTPQLVKDLSGLAGELRLTIIGSMPEKGTQGIYNTAYVLDADGSVAAAYRKVHLFSPTLEDRYFKAGQSAVVSKTSLGPIGLMICYDLRFPELCRTLALRGATMIAVMAQWPAARIAHWRALLKARAIENQLFVIGANRCGKDGDLVYGGHSRIISPFGEVLAKAGTRPAGLSAVIDLREVEETRRRITYLHDRAPEAYA